MSTKSKFILTKTEELLAELIAKQDEFLDMQKKSLEALNEILTALHITKLELTNGTYPDLKEEIPIL